MVFKKKFYFIVLVLFCTLTNVLGQNKNALLYESIKQKDINYDKIEKLIDEGAQVNKAYKYDNTLLHYAVSYLDYKLCSILLAKGANPNLEDSLGFTPLARHVLNGLDFSLNKHVKVYESKGERTIFKKMAHLSIQGPKYKTQNKRINKAFEKYYKALEAGKNKKYASFLENVRRDYFGILELLLKNSANPDVHVNTYKQSRTVLQRAIMDNQTETVKLLLKHGANPNFLNEFKLDPLYYAVEAENYFITEALLKHKADFSYRKNDKIVSSYSLAIKNGNINLVNLFLQYGAPIHRNVDMADVYPVNYAAMKGHTAMVDLFVKNGSPVKGKYPSGRSPLMYACSGRGNSNVIQYLLQKGANIHFTAKNGMQPVHFLAQKGSTADLATILKRGGKINTQNNKGETPLHLAASAGRDENVELLRSYGADVKIKNSAGKTPLQVAKNSAVEALQKPQINMVISFIKDTSNPVDLLDRIIKTLPDLNETDKKGYTLLGRSVQKGNREAAAFFLKQGCDVNKANNSGWTPLHLACYYGDYHTARLLLKQNARLDLKTKNKNTPFMVAIQKRHLQLVKLLDSAGVDLAEPEKYYLYAAARRGYSDITKYLLQQGADPAFKNPLLKAILEKYPDIAMLILDYEVPLNPVTDKGNTPLHIAIKRDYWELAQKLVSKGANLNALNKKNNTPLQTALYYPHTEKYVKFFIDSGADVNFKYTEDFTVFSYFTYSCRNEKIIKWFLDAGADVKIQHGDGISLLMKAASNNANVEVIKMLVDAGADINAEDEYKNNLMHHAARNRYLTMVRYFSKKGLDVNSQNDKGNTPLMIASWQKNHKGTVKMLLALGAKVKEKNKKGETALMMAAHYAENPEIVEILLEHGAKPGRKDKSGYDAYHHLKKNDRYTMRNNRDLEKLLKQ